MEAYIDIDGVLARDNVPALLTTLNRAMKLAIPDDQLAAIKTKKAFRELAQTQEYREQVGQALYQRQVERLEWHPLYTLELLLIERALEGIRYLAQRCPDIYYCTARYINFNEDWNRRLAQATRLWLGNNGFPRSEEVLFCDGIAAKLKTIAAKLREQPCNEMLIDDSAPELMETLGSLPEEDQGLLCEHLTLVAFGYDDVPEHSPIQIIPFPRWNEVVNLCVEKEFNYHGTRKQQS